MNQDQNNFNIQGNNGISNNQPENNHNTNLNEETISVQTQSTTSFQQPTTSFQPTIQEPTPQPINNTFESGNVNNQNINNKPQKKINLGLIIGLIVIVIVVGGIGSFLLFANTKKEVSNNLNSKEEQEKNNSNNNVAISNEIIKVVSEEYDTYLLSAEGKIYSGNLENKEKFSEIKLNTKNKVKDIAITDRGLLFKLDNGEFYLISHYIKTDKEIETSSYSSAKRIMLDNITQYAFEDVSCSNNLFLTEDGDLYDLTFDSSDESEIETEAVTNVNKIMSNIKKIESSLRNTAIIDKDNNGYICGYNVKEEGILGTSEGIFKNKVCTPVKIGENIKEIDIFGWNLMDSLNIYYINTNNELFVIGQSANNNYFMETQNNFVDKPIKIYDNVKDVHAMSMGIIIETLDGKLIQKNTWFNLKETEITNNYNKVIVPRGYGGIFILKNNNELYAYGTNDGGKFGLKDSNFDEITKVKDNVKNVFISGDFNGKDSFIVTKEGKLFTSGYHTDGNFIEINY